MFQLWKEFFISKNMCCKNFQNFIQALNKLAWNSKKKLMCASW